MYAAWNFHQFAILPHKHPLSNTSPYSASATDFNSFIYQFMDLLDLENGTMEMAFILPTFTINQATWIPIKNSAFCVCFTVSIYSFGLKCFKLVVNLVKKVLKK